MDEAKLNSIAWDAEAKRMNYWTIPTTKEEIEMAKSGDLRVRLTPSSFVNRAWIKNTKGKDVLLLASAGGQQTPLFAAYGANVYSLDISPEMIKRDRETLSKYGLKGAAELGDMRDLSRFDNASFDYVFIPHSINFISSLDALYSEVDRVLRKNGHFLFGVANPVLYLFDEKKRKRLKVKYTLPFSDGRSKSKRERERMIKTGDTFESSHTLSSVMSPLFEKGFVLVDFYSDSSLDDLVDSYICDSFLAFNFLKC